MKKAYLSLFLVGLTFSVLNAQEEKAAKSDSTKKATKELPLEPVRNFKSTITEGTWMSLDISPDGTKILFDLLGDLYEMPINGGKATALTQGLAYEVHPRYSPDGKSIVYISDKSGADNIWIMALDSKKERALTKDKNQNYFSADWSPDGQYIIGAKGRRAIALHYYHQDGGSGTQLMEDAKGLKIIDPAFGAQGRYLYFSQRKGAWDYNAQLPQYQIGRYDMQEGERLTLTSRYGSAFTPVLSPNGQWLVYGSRFEDKTGLVLRNLETGDESWLAYPIQRDEQESIATLGVLPGMSFDPSSENLYLSYDGKFHRVNLASKEITHINFEVDLNLDLGPELDFQFPISDEPEAPITQIRDAVPSPDGRQLAFTALNRLYVMDLPQGKPKQLGNQDFTQAMPSWSPDGKWLVYATWEGKEGHLYKVKAKGGKPIRLTQKPGLYRNPVWSPQGDRIVLLAAPAQKYRDAYSPFISDAGNQIAWISSQGGAIQVIAEADGRSNPHFSASGERIYLNNSKGLISIRWDGSDEKEHLKVTGITTYGSSLEKFHDHTGGHSLLPSDPHAWTEKNKPSTASLLFISPDESQAIAQINNDLYTVSIPRYGKTPKISVAKAENAAFPARKLTEMGGEFPAWDASGKKVYWSLGPAHFIYDLEKAQAAEDSAKAAKEAEKAAEKSASEKDSTTTETEEKSEKKDKKKEDKPVYQAQEFRVDLNYTRDIPQGYILIENARLLTMKGQEVIENGDLLIHKNRIAQVGPHDSFEVPAGTKRLNAQGKTVLPGFVDTHAHMWPNWGIHKNQVWLYAANLAYGVTTTRDPQTATTDVLTYGDMVETGQILGPRIYSTGPGVGFWAYNIQSLEHAKKVLKQYADYYQTKTIKMYLTGNRQQRQWIIMACKELGLRPTTEGGLDYKLNMTQILDGYPGHEHALPIYPIHQDVVDFVAKSRTTVTPTLLVAYGGPFAENYFYATEEVYHDEKLQFFTPYEELASKARRRGSWFMKEEHVFPKHAEFIKDLVEAGGYSGVGSHGQLQGLGYHWELWAMASGGIQNYDALRVATILGAEGLGLGKDLGSLEVGKIADILILSENPLEDIRHTNSVETVIKNGRAFDANTLDQIAPEAKAAEEFLWHFDAPSEN